MKAKFIAYVILILVVIVIAVIIIAANSELEPQQNQQQPELSDYEKERLQEDVYQEPIEIQDTETQTGDDIADFAEVEPTFPGGEEEMAKFIRENVEYPELAREMGEQGTVYVQFVVNSDGSIQDVVVLKGVSKLLDREAVRVVKMMPDWTPGMQHGETIRVRYQIPIRFSIG